MIDVKKLLGEIVGLFVGIIFFLLSYFASNFFGLDSSIGIALALLLGFGATFTYDRTRILSSLEKQVKDSEASIIRSLFPGRTMTGEVRLFRNTTEATQYIKDRIPNSTHVWNTRLGRFTNDVEFNAHNVQNETYLQAIKNGAVIDFVFDTRLRPQTEGLIKLVRGFPQGRNGAEFTLYEVNFAGAPVLQMIGLSYPKNDNEVTTEVLIGWDLGDERRGNETVILIRDEKIVRYFEEVFKNYKNLSAVERIY